MFASAGATGALIASIDWAAHPLGTPDRWPHSLRTLVATLLHSRQPMFLWWGESLYQFYNDSYLPSFGDGKHPAAMGQRGADCFREAWPAIWPQIEGVLSSGKSTWDIDRLVPITRNGRLEEVYWTYSYSPVFGDDGRIGGVLVTCMETTHQVIKRRREATLRAAVEAAVFADEGATLEQVLAAAVRQGRADMPWSLLVEFDPAQQRCALLYTHGLTREGRALVTRRLEAHWQAMEPHWHAAEVLLLSSTDPLASLLRRERDEPPCDEPPCRAYVAPLPPAKFDRRQRALVVGLSARLAFDDAYRRFLDDLVDRLASAHRRLQTLRASAAAERERNNLLMQAPVATALFKGPDHVFHLANAHYQRMVGGRPLIGRPYVEAFPELAHTELPEIFDRVYETGEPFVAEEHPISLDLDGDGALTPCYFRFNLEPLRDAQGEVYGMMAVATNVTEQVNARKLLERTNAERSALLAELEAANRAKDQFLAILGHELRNPLSPILTALHLMQLKGETPTSPEQQIIQRQVQHMVRLVDDLLDLSRITRGKIELRRERVDIGDVIARAIEIASPLIEERRHELVLRPAPLGATIQVDPDRIAQAIANLLTNAARYSDPQGWIEISSALRDGRVEVHVRDRGIGLSESMLATVFEPFVQHQREVNQARGGLGVGLTIVKSLVELHGGRVHAASEGPGRGSEFWIELPAAIDEEVPALPPTIGAPVLRSRHCSRILVVDDNEDGADMLAALLEQLGHTVQVAYDPATALQNLDGFAPQVALLDIGLPVMDGYELARELRARLAAPCRFIALTGYGQAADLERSMRAGFEAHLVKPVPLDRLVALLDSPATAGPMRVEPAQQRQMA